MVKKSECVAGATRSSQDLVEYVSKTCRYVKRGLGGDELKATNTIQLCFADEVMYNVMDEKTITGLWSKLEILYMAKSLSNKLYLKKQIYRLRMKEGTTVLEHLNFFNKVIGELPTVDVKIDEEDKALILLSLLQSHMITS